ncbi:hypothetical protein SKAU_G00291950 [Synaphobranchus kaupii]|uniref:Uncharacterized protein n=1 Tax=Synaphobranchus kaupii TaxID=118154 RepID=A0A9Q1ETX8_SYNKA|nr:hypothetical protein SKAU_G00291950 [Synaphobranchus kaupii]
MSQWIQWLQLASGSVEIIGFSTKWIRSSFPIVVLRYLLSRWAVAVRRGPACPLYRPCREREAFHLSPCLSVLRLLRYSPQNTPGSLAARTPACSTPHRTPTQV